MDEYKTKYKLIFCSSFSPYLLVCVSFPQFLHVQYSLHACQKNMSLQQSLAEKEQLPIHKNQTFKISSFIEIQLRIYEKQVIQMPASKLHHYHHHMNHCKCPSQKLQLLVLNFFPSPAVDINNKTTVNVKLEHCPTRKLPHQSNFIQFLPHQEFS